MCRHAAWLGRPASLQELLIDPPHGLVRQSWAPRRQRHGTVNADGFGIGWYAGGAAVRYRRDVPLWAEPGFASLAPAVRSTCVLAAVRSATAGGPSGAEACAPFLLPGQVLLSHNGAVPLAAVAPLVSSAALAAIGSTVDSAFVAALVAQRLGDGLAAALAGAVAAVTAVAPEARLNLLGTDGTTVAATAWGDTLCWRAAAGGVVVASEPSDDDTDWIHLPDRSLLVLTPDGCAVTSLSDTP
ncbi:MAG: ergothioneine biosynthesis protein EgtC [Frankiales bacterium]|nr:ergothioneine biosynthesis protein EgtC [Frankiales bacterium]